MSYADNNGVKIHYEVEGNGPPIILQHGITGEINIWRLRGYTDELKKEHKLILIDARGHGKSDKPRETAAYAPEAMTGDIIKVLDDLGVEKTRYWGYSMGSMIGFQLLRLHPQRFTSLILGGMSANLHHSNEERVGEDNTRIFIEKAFREGVDSAISLRERAGVVMDEAVKQYYRGLDWGAMYAAFKGITGWRYVEDLLAGYSTPCLWYAGTRDPFHDGARRGAGLMRSAKFVSIPGTDHNGTMFSSGLVLPHVKRFLSEVS
jgi:pimeloyl-ACP methyl ester carboxylesterase